MRSMRQPATQALAARSLGLKPIASSSKAALERARIQSGAMACTKIDIQNILHFVDDESDDTSDTKSTGSSSPSGSAGAPPIAARRE